ncbi:hypothetical protein HAX54_038195, partial [Datura stramonium]|nr:hypothetical protein [Datura stramonium]
MSTPKPRPSLDRIFVQLKLDTRPEPHPDTQDTKPHPNSRLIPDPGIRVEIRDQ